MSSQPFTLSARAEPERTATWPLFIRAHAKLVQAVEAELMEAGLPGLAWHDVLCALDDAPQGRMRMSELAEMVLLSRSNLTRLVDRMEQIGYIRRAACNTDRRGYFAECTETGRAVRQRMAPLFRQSVRRHFEQFVDDREVAVLERVFGKLLRQSRK